MAGQVVLYIDVTYLLKRPDSSRPPSGAESGCVREAERKPHCGRPQALKSRVATREAVWPSAQPTVREAEWLSALPTISIASPKEKKR